MEQGDDLLLIPIFGLLEWQTLVSPAAPVMRTVRLVAELALQAALWAGLRYFSTHFYEPHPTYAAIVWKQNVRFLFNPLHWPTMTSVFAFLWVLYVVQFRRIGHRGLQLCAVLLPVWFIIMFIVGDLLEIRIHSEWIGYFAICTILIWADLLQSPDKLTRSFTPQDEISG